MTVAGLGSGKGDSSGSLRSPQWTLALLQGCSSALVTIDARTGLSSTYRIAAQRCDSSIGHEENPPCHKRPRILNLLLKYWVNCVWTGFSAAAMLLTKTGMQTR